LDPTCTIVAFKYTFSAYPPALSLPPLTRVRRQPLHDRIPRCHGGALHFSRLKPPAPLEQSALKCHLPPRSGEDSPSSLKNVEPINERAITRGRRRRPAAQCRPHRGSCRPAPRSTRVESCLDWQGDERSRWGYRSIRFRARCAHRCRP
jgi:hypothetical protein